MFSITTKTQFKQIDQQDATVSRLRLDVYVWLTMFRAPLRPSSRA